MLSYKNYAVKQVTKQLILLLSQIQFRTGPFLMQLFVVYMAYTIGLLSEAISCHAIGVHVFDLLELWGCKL